MNYLLQEKIKEREIFLSNNIENNKSLKGISIISVVHLLDTGVPYVNTLSKLFSLEGIIPKPKSIDNRFYPFYPKDKILSYTRDDLKKSQVISDLINKIPKGNKLILLDIGGYFASSVNLIKEKMGDLFLGVIEDTENGHQKYKEIKNIKIPVVSVARSILKSNEDHLVGQAVVFSTEAILRDQGIIFNNKNVGIVGFGKIGNGIISSLRDKGAKVSVFDKKHTTLLLALSRGYDIKAKNKLLDDSEIIFCSSGNLSIKGEEFRYLKNNVFVVSVTSSDDELDLIWLKNNYYKQKISTHIDLYEKNGHNIYLLNDGNAVNFIHGAVIGDFILLVQMEIIDSIIYVNKNIKELKNGVQEGFSDIEERIADLWLKKIKGVNI